MGGSAKTTRGGGGTIRASKRSRQFTYTNPDDSADDDFGDEKADYGEVTELYEDATLSIEELRRKYYGGGGGDGEDRKEVGDGGGKAAATADPAGSRAKRARLEESDDDECEF